MLKDTRPSGFTLIEVIAVLLVLGVLAAVVISRMTSTADTDLKGAAEALKSHIRYAQMRAMNADASDPTVCNASFGIAISGNTYFMFRDCATANNNKVALPGAEGDTIGFSNTSLADNGVPTVTFDERGRPCTDLNGNQLAAADIIWGMSKPGASETITITKNTGFVP